MIVTLTPNPSIDRTVVLGGRLERGAVHRADAVLSQAGGKGVNISRACCAAGVDTVAVLPAAADDPFTRELVADQIPHVLVGLPGRVRVNLTISEPGGSTTKINTPGPTSSPDMLERLAARLTEQASRADWVVLAGSLPPGAPHSWYAELVIALRGLTQVAVDTSEAPLAALVARLDDAPPHLMKPNSEELASLTGVDPVLLEQDPVAVARSARTLLARGVTNVLATLGGHGAVLVTADGAWHATPPPTDVVSTVGAGDSSLFGYLLGDLRGHDPAQRLALAVAYGSAAAGLAGTTAPRPSDVRPDLVVVRELSINAHPQGE